MLPIFCATLLTDDPVDLVNVPDITDLEKLVAFLRAQGSRIDWDRAAGTMRIDHAGFRGSLADDELPAGHALVRPALSRPPPPPAAHRHPLQRQRLLARGARDRSAPGDAPRPRGEGADGESLVIDLPEGFRGGRHWLDYMSVTVTENFAMAAALAAGGSTLINAASEPHVQDLCGALVAMGARIEGIGTSRLEITGVDRLHGARIAINTDYHEVVTFLALGAITGGEVRVENSLPQHFDLIARAFGKLGVVISTRATPPGSPAPSAWRSSGRSPATCCRRSRPRPGLTSPWTCCP